MPGKDPGGVIITMLLGIAGSLVAGFVGRAFGWYHSGTSGPGIIASIIGAMALLGIYRLLLRRRHTVGLTRPSAVAGSGRSIAERGRLSAAAPRSAAAWADPAPDSASFRVFPWREGRVRSRVRSDRSPHG